MKFKKFILLSSILFFVGCGSNSDKVVSSQNTSQNEIKDPEAAKGLDLITRTDCFTCHQLTQTTIGPAYSAIALKYKFITASNMDSMVTQIINGGKGRWGNIPMTAHPGISKEDAQSMVHYIMSIKPE